MKFKLYQINLNDQTAKYCFTNKSELEKFGLGFPPPANLYRLRYVGECKTLDPHELWPLLNINHPADYKTRNLSVGDIIVYDLASQPWHSIAIPFTSTLWTSQKMKQRKSKQSSSSKTAMRISAYTPMTAL